ncbi:MAG: tryptophan 2,3-dioxygenase [Candidatus Nanopelagicaceae bacterium]|nr:tryptophan 2,3-dioxygenase [Candidatus Nanopelagicaceae bacterium]
MSYGPDQILDGVGKSDYERYLKLSELLQLQPVKESWKHRDELLFTVVHQTSELWLKHASAEAGQAAAYLKDNQIRSALRLFPRILLAIKYCHESLDMLEQMSPWDYQQVRRALGHGSGFDSPGMNSIRKAIPPLGVEFNRLLGVEKIDLIQLFIRHTEFEDLYLLAESLIELDERMYLWRHRHFKVVERSIGLKVSGTQGTPVEILSRLNNFTFFPELWDARTAITNYAIAEEGEN